jgi:hypothetical protein
VNAYISYMQLDFVPNELKLMIREHLEVRITQTCKMMHDFLTYRHYSGAPMETSKGGILYFLLAAEAGDAKPHRPLLEESRYISR